MSSLNLYDGIEADILHWAGVFESGGGDPDEDMNDFIADKVESNADELVIDSEDPGEYTKLYTRFKVYITGVLKSNGYLKAPWQVENRKRKNKSLKERIVRFPVKGSWHAKECKDLAEPILEKALTEKKINNWIADDGQSGENPGIYFSVKGVYNHPYQTSYEFFAEFANDGTYIMICQKDNDTESLAEWTGKFEEEFESDFKDAISLSWT